MKQLKNIIVDDKIFIIRGIQVMIDRDLAELYEVETRALNQAVKRNSESFPNDFMFELNNDEKNELITKCDNLKSLKFNPSKIKVFTEQGVYMLATVLKSKIAREVNISIMRTFTKLKNQSVPYFDIVKRIEKLEISDNQTKELLSKIVQVINNMQEIQDEAKEDTKKIGFV
ncbi:ORF6N domain-containing protein [Halarcobacter anaerophilus]|uniref:DNA-binding protein n=1 Tax=Halarcobacter anaerophilus TaxID=877500 RepID=A0A4Q0XZ11_9BACT|nr:ORF6N domain-containing protein [Halarcobacter anaerophilus]QDF29890.1 ORF6N domain-containing protein [Halarcobacter anaerophilus]RXJ62852.1 DNA-binding protein [Halarcobacter anaerophilus]